jgi:hypothetical protein
MPSFPLSPMNYSDTRTTLLDNPMLALLGLERCDVPCEFETGSNPQACSDFFALPCRYPLEVSVVIATCNTMQRFHLSELQSINNVGLKQVFRK